MLQHVWRVELLGGVRLVGSDRVWTRFRTQKSALLLACLAYYPERVHSREQLMELLWPGKEPDAARNSLRAALSSIRSILEPPGVGPGCVLEADRLNVRLNPAAYTCDTADLVRELRLAASAPESERRAHLERAIGLYHGDLLPGFYEDWVLTERERLSELLVATLREAGAAATRAGEHDRAVTYLKSAAAVDPYREEIHCMLIQALMHAGRDAAALRQYDALETMLRQEFDCEPGREAQELAARLGHQRRAGRPAPEPRELPRPQYAPCAPAQPAGEPRFHLPVPLTRFFGRDQELAYLLEWLQPEEAAPQTAHRARQPERLVTLTGAGGCGKTRLAIEAARRLRQAYGGRIGFVPLASVTEPDEITGAILQSLGQGPAGAQSAEEALQDHLGASPTMLLLDNLEQLLVGDRGTRTALAIRWLLEHIEGLSFLVTSRQLVEVDGERELSVQPLHTPSAPGSPVRLLEFPSVELFVDRAQAVRSDFHISKSNADTIAALCHRLEGIPLALELAAAWARTLSPGQLLEQLSHRCFDVLVTNRRDAAERHRTLLAALEWSYALLAPELQRLLARLSVFSGGWTLEAARDICQAPDAASALGHLQACSLLIAEPVGEGLRFRFLQMVRDFAADHLEAQEARLYGERHVAYYLAMAERTEPQIQAGSRELYEMLEAENENFRSALDFCVSAALAGGPGAAELRETGLKLAGALWRFWNDRGHLTDGRQRLERILSVPGEPTRARARALTAAGVLASTQTDLAAARAYEEESLAIRQALKDPEGAIAAMSNLGAIAFKEADYQRACRLYKEGLELARQVGSDMRAAACLNNLGNALMALGRHDEAVGCFEESLAIRNRRGDVVGAGAVLCNLGNMAFYAGNIPLARERLEQSLSIKRRAGDRLGEGITLTSLVPVTVAQGEQETARGYLDDALAIWTELGNREGLAAAIEAAAELSSVEGAGDRSVQLYAAAETIRSAWGCPMLEAERQQRDGRLAAVKGEIGARAYQRAWDRGAGLSPEEATAAARLVDTRRQPAPDRAG